MTDSAAQGIIVVMAVCAIGIIVVLSAIGKPVYEILRLLRELAQNRTEAQELFDQGCGYKSRTAAMKARSSPEIDSYYRNLMKVFEFSRKGVDDGR